MASSARRDSVPRRTALGEVAWLFVKLGSIAFGGPAAHIALMREELVARRRWLSEQQFLDLVGATSVIPGPNSTELAIHVGYARAGGMGLVIAGACFILPASLSVTALAWAYVRFGALPAAEGLLRGLKPAVIVLVLQAIVGLARTAVTSWALAALAGACGIAFFLGGHELLVLAGGAIGGALLLVSRGQGGIAAVSSLIGVYDVNLRRLRRAIPYGLLTGTGMATAAAVVHPPMWAIFGMFFKVGALLFGSGYVLLAFLQADLVDRHGWLSSEQLLSAVAIGQITPGPVFTTATFIGYLLGGVRGAAVATVGIFAPAFAYVAASAPLVPRLRRSPVAGAMLDGVNVASLALMAVAAWRLGRDALVDPFSLLLAAVGAVVLLRWRVNPAWILLGGALAGLLRY